MLNLSDREWGTFSIGSLFSLETGKGRGLKHLNQTTKCNGVSYLGATNRNNGVICFVERESSMVQRGNCIAFIRNGEGSIGFSVYKEKDFVATSDLTIGNNEHINRYVGVSITTIADSVCGKYNFNYKRSETRLAKEMLQLPVSDDGEPDWVFMEQYIQEREQGLLLQYKSYIKERSLSIVGEDCSQFVNVERRAGKCWREFELSKIFPIIQRGKRLKTADHIVGSKPYVSSSAVNNGVDAFISNDSAVRAFENCITIANSGSVGRAFYHPYSFVASATLLNLKIRDSVPKHICFCYPLFPGSVKNTTSITKLTTLAYGAKE